jgi:hypothetical protein
MGYWARQKELGRTKRRGELKLESIVETPKLGPPSKQGQELGSM